MRRPHYVPTMLLAHSVMPNHFHLVVRQGVRPLGWVMHPIMRRTALLIQRALDRKDHVLGENGGVLGIEIVHGLKLFGDMPNRSVVDLRDAYTRYVRWRLQKDRYDELGIPFGIPEPPSDAGDRYFSEFFTALPTTLAKPRKDLRDRAVELLERIDGTTSIESLRRRNLSRVASAIRKQVIAGLLQSGYRGKQIADFLRISDSTVCAVASAMRYAS